MAAVKTLPYRPTAPTRFTGVKPSGVTTKSIIDHRRQSTVAHATTQSLHKHETHSKKINQPQQQQQHVPQQPNPRQILIGKRRSNERASCTIRQRQEQTSTASKKTTTQPIRPCVTEVGNPSARQLALASEAYTNCSTSDTVRISQLELPMTQPLPATWSSAELDSWKSSNDNTDGVSGNCSADFVVTASSTGYDVMSSKSACETPGVYRRSSIQDTELLHLPPICTSSTCLIHVIWDGNNDKNINNHNIINNNAADDDRPELIGHEQTSSRRVVDQTATTRLQPKAVNRSQPGIVGCSKGALLSESGSFVGVLLSVPPSRNLTAKTRQAATKSLRKKSVPVALRFDREPTSDDTLLRKWKSQPAIGLPPLTTVARKMTSRSELESAAMIASRGVNTVSRPPNSRCNSPTTERILMWLMDVEASGPAERPLTPFVDDDEPLQTDTAIHIIYGED